MISCWVVLDGKQVICDILVGVAGPMTALSYYAGSRTGSPYDEISLLREGYRVVRGELNLEVGECPEIRYPDDDVVYLCPDCGILSSYYEVFGGGVLRGVDWWLGCTACKAQLEEIGYIDAVLLIERGHSEFDKDDL